MPFPIYAVPLTRDWLGIYQWKTSKPEDLPQELEYLSFQEFEDRFTQLNRIARPTYPTVWPNVAAIVLLTGIAMVAAFGITHTGTTMAVMGQTACFFFPIMVVVWIKIRAETLARSRKKFKYQSQKLLREWTAQDTETHAIQWKIRLRPKSEANKWLRHRQVQHQQQQQHGYYYTQSQHDHAYHDGRLVNDMSSLLQYQQRQQHYGGTDIVTYHLPSDYIMQGQQIQSQPSGNYIDVVIQHPVTEQPSSSSSSSVMATATTAVELSKPGWTTFCDRMKNSLCLGYIFRERKVWLIEISFRDYQLEDDALTIPSPVYCDYRLPVYEDIVSIGTAADDTIMPLPQATTIVAPAATHALLSTSANSDHLTINFYLDEPPAYESRLEDSDSDNGNEANAPSFMEPYQGQQQQQQMTMVQRLAGLTSVTIMPSSSRLDTCRYTMSSADGPARYNRLMVSTHEGASSTVSLPLVERKEYI
ncbi:hypothetical protein BX616_010903 [Lobosporangium transversale]|nr:hypothetical protein BX616_010903 [Lobosporangium transversale]